LLVLKKKFSFVYISFLTPWCDPVTITNQPEHAVAITRYALVGGVKKTPVFVFTHDRLAQDQLQCVDVTVAQALVRRNALASTLDKYWHP
jgi:hypothetical protein